MNGPVFNTVKRKEKLKKVLLDNFGSDNKLTVEEEISKSDVLFIKGLEFQEILDILTQNIENSLKQSSNSRQLYKSPQMKLRIERPRNSSYCEIARNERSIHLSRDSSISSVNNWEEYSHKHNQHYEEFMNINHSIEKVQKNAYKILPPLEVFSKIDEIKAIEAAKEREEQGRAVEFKRKVDKFIAERETAGFLEKQIQARQNHLKSIELQNRDYGQQLEERSKFIKIVDIHSKQRKDLIKNAYSQALQDQILQKVQHRSLISHLSNEGRRINCSDSTSVLADYSQSSARSGSINSYQQKSPSPQSFLMQYGNYIVGPSKK